MKVIGALLAAGLVVLSSAASPFHHCLDTIVSIPELKNLVDHFTVAGLDKMFNDANDLDRGFTFFAPSNQAFADAADVVATFTDETLRGVMMYHMLTSPMNSSELNSHDFRDYIINTHCPLQGQHELILDFYTFGRGKSKIRIAGEARGVGTTTTVDIPCGNSVIHIIDAVLVPYLSIMETALYLPELKTLVDQLTTVGLAETLNQSDSFPSFHLFAPSNQAFTNAGDVVAALTNETLFKVLAYHVTDAPFPPGGYFPKDLADGDYPSSFLDHNLSVSSSGEYSSLFDISGETNSAVMTRPDVVCNNGFIHIVDEVLVPKLAHELQQEGGNDAFV